MERGWSVSDRLCIELFGGVNNNDKFPASLPPGLTFSLCVHQNIKNRPLNPSKTLQPFLFFDFEISSSATFPTCLAIDRHSQQDS